MASCVRSARRISTRASVRSTNRIPRVQALLAASAIGDAGGGAQRHHLIVRGRRVELAGDAAAATGLAAVGIVAGAALMLVRRKVSGQGCVVGAVWLEWTTLRTDARLPKGAQTSRNAKHPGPYVHVPRAPTRTAADTRKRTPGNGHPAADTWQRIPSRGHPGAIPGR